jgi:protein-S-isoprenylcysteine O-methyltransferase Ste14
VFETLVAALARLRVALGWVFGLLVIVLAEPTVRTIAIGMSIAVLGEAIRIWAAGHLYKSREVTSSGPYRFVGHPLYLGSSIMGFGLAVACNSVLVAALVVLYLATTITAAIKSEEAFLRRHFGEQYELYRSGVAEQRRSPGARRRRFSVRQALANREHRAILGLAGAILLLALKATYNGAFWQAAGTHVVRPGG